MPTLNITVKPRSHQLHQLFVRPDGVQTASVVDLTDPQAVADLLGWSGFENEDGASRRLWFSASRMEDGVVSKLSDEKAFTFTLRKTPVVIELPDPPKLDQLPFVVEVVDDDPENDYSIEVTPS